MEKKYPRILFRKKLKDLRKDMEEVSQKTLKTHKTAIDLLMEYDDEKKEKVIRNSKIID